VTEILGGMWFVKEGGEFKKKAVITDDLLALTLIFDKEASCVISRNVIIELLIFHRQTSSADRSSAYFHCSIWSVMRLLTIIKNKIRPVRVPWGTPKRQEVDRNKHFYV